MLSKYTLQMWMIKQPREQILNFGQATILQVWMLFIVLLWILAVVCSKTSASRQMDSKNFVWQFILNIFKILYYSSVLASNLHWQEVITPKVQTVKDVNGSKSKCLFLGTVYRWRFCLLFSWIILFNMVCKWYMINMWIAK